jgi:uncharacterized protein (DUF433 family)
VDYAHLIVRDPKLCDGEPVIRGTRVTLRTILASLAEGDGFEEILRNFPSLTPHDLRAIVGYAAAAAQGELPASGVPMLKSN